MHARPAGLFVQTMQAFHSAITIVRDDQQADGKKLIALMKLRLKCGESFRVCAEGEDESAAIAMAREFLSAHL
jgi:phosphotransferase system HPr (HPr) family protein